MKHLLKYCGNHSLEDVQVTAKSNADFLGFVFAPSKRVVTALQVKEWLSKVDVKQQIVGVFVNATLEEIEAILKIVSLDVIQCHGEETPDFLRNLKAKTNKTVWKVIHHQQNGVEMMKQYSGLSDGFVIDSKVDGSRGGTGIQFDWEAVPLYEQEAKRQNVPYFIAGGINVSTISDLLLYQPLGIDLSSGIEESGRKSTKIIEQLEKRF